MADGLELLEGRWYVRRQAGDVELERYLDIRGDHFFLAEQYHKGGPYKTRQAVLTLSVQALADGRLQADLTILKILQDGSDLSGEWAGARMLALSRREEGGLRLALGEPGAPRPLDVASGDLFQKKG